MCFLVRRRGIFKAPVPQELFPLQIIPAGSDQARQQYLFEQIREFCAKKTKDLVCPLPASVSEKSDEAQ